MSIFFFCSSYSISIHSLRMEGDTFQSAPSADGYTFQSTPSAWRETEKARNYIVFDELFQSTPSAWRETKAGIGQALDYVTFQSTPSAWRETSYHEDEHITPEISIHSLRMEGDICQKRGVYSWQISIHSLRMEGDLRFRCNLQVDVVFQSTPSAWRETMNNLLSRSFRRISIHSLRMEGDNHNMISVQRYAIFQSTPSAWRETLTSVEIPEGTKFQSTPSAWRETAFPTLRLP